MNKAKETTKTYSEEEVKFIQKTAIITILLVGIGCWAAGYITGLSTPIM